MESIVDADRSQSRISLSNRFRLIVRFHFTIFHGRQVDRFLELFSYSEKSHIDFLHFSNFSIRIIDNEYM